MVLLCRSLWRVAFTSLKYEENKGSVEIRIQIRVGVGECRGGVRNRTMTKSGGGDMGRAGGQDREGGGGG